jgi:hypothetical protein
MGVKMMKRNFLVSILLAIITAVGILGFTPLAVLAAAPNVVAGAAVVDGSYSEWNLTNDFFANMYVNGDSSKELWSRAYLRYDYTSGTMYVLVLDETTKTSSTVAGNAWVALCATTDDNIKNNKVVVDSSGNDGTPPDFAWVAASGGFAQGYEASFKVDPGSWLILIHIEAGSSGTSATVGFKGNGDPLVIKYPTTIITSLDKGSIYIGGTVSDAITLSTTSTGVLPIATGKVTLFASNDVTFSSGVFEVQSPSFSHSLPYTFSTTDWAPPTAGTWYFKAVYSGDANYLDCWDDPHNEVLEVSKWDTEVNTVLSANSTFMGLSVTDNITIKSTGSYPLTGTWRLQASQDPNFSTGIVEIDNGTVNGMAPFNITSKPWANTAAGTWYFKASYSGDSHYSDSYDDPKNEILEVSVGGVPLPELPSMALLAVGLAIIGGFIFLRRRSRPSRS